MNVTIFSYNWTVSVLVQLGHVNYNHMAKAVQSNHLSITFNEGKVMNKQFKLVELLYNLSKYPLATAKVPSGIQVCPGWDSLN